jgi:hypothetical protein
MGYLELKVSHVQDLILLLLSLVGHPDRHLGDLDVDEELVPLCSLLHFFHVVLNYDQNYCKFETLVTHG